MNREIKFRVWDKTTDTMFEDNKNTDITIEVYREMVDINGIPIDYENECEAVLMQYTGLKDKNNKEIYEGDILKEENGDLDVCLYLEVVASYGFVPIEIYMYNYKEQGESINELSLVEEMYKEYDIQCFPRNLTPRDYLEVIGNIYENPELLKTEL